MAKKIKYLIVILAFMGVNLYLGVRLIRQMNEFRLENLPFTVEILREKTPEFTGYLDVDKDGDNDGVAFCYVNIPNDNELLVFDGDSGDFENGDSISFPLPQDYAFFDFYRKKNSRAYVFRLLKILKKTFSLIEQDNQQKILKEFKFDELNIGLRQIGSITPPLLIDLDADGKKELCIGLTEGYLRYPRGVACFDYESGRLLWEYYCGASFVRVKVIDLDGDEKKEIVLSCTAVNNGAQMNGTNDANSYVLVLDSKGNETWKKETGDWYTLPQSVIADLDHDGCLEIVTATECHRAHADVKGMLFIFDGKTGKIKAKFSHFDGSFSKPFVLTANKTERQIVVGDSNGGIWMFDQNLKPIKKINVKSPVAILNAQAGNNQWKYLFAGTTDKLLVFNNKLERKIFQYKFEKSVPRELHMMPHQLIPFHHKIKGDYYFLIADKLYGISQPQVSLIFILKKLAAGGLFFSFLLLLFFNGFFIYFISRFKSFIFPSSSLETGSDTNRFLEILQGIAHQLKNPISTVMWTAEKIKRSAAGNKQELTRDNYRELSDFLLEDVNILRKQTNNMLKLIQIQKPRFQQKKLNPILEQLVDRYRAEIGEKIDIHLETTADITLYIDEELFREAIVNLVDNAVDAMPEGGKLSVCAKPVVPTFKRGIRQVVIEIKDTGPGIDEDDISKIFTPFFTKKEKSIGIGLTLCQRIIGAHGGKIEARSRKGFGTKMVITMPVKKRIKD
jgi:signal transduction histidine kinase